MDEEEFDSLRRWGEALHDDPRAEVRAAGKAITLLAAEVERLQVELWHLKLGVESARRAAEEERIALDAALLDETRSVLGRLRGAAKRLQPERLFHRDER